MKRLLWLAGFAISFPACDQKHSLQSTPVSTPQGNSGEKDPTAPPSPPPPEGGTKPVSAPFPFFTAIPAIQPSSPLNESLTCVHDPVPEADGVRYRLEYAWKKNQIFLGDWKADAASLEAANYTLNEGLSCGIRLVEVASATSAEHWSGTSYKIESIPSCVAPDAEIVPAAVTPALPDARVFYVAPQGSDGNPGTLAAPVATLNRCVNGLAAPGDECILRAGTYRQAFTPFKSGEAGKPIVVAAFPGEVVTLSSMATLSGWEKDPESGEAPIYRTLAMNWTLATTEPGRDNIVVDGRQLPEARWPDLANKSVGETTRSDLARTDGGSGNASAATGTVVTGRFESAGLTQFADGSLNGAFITFVPGNMWTYLSGTVTQSAGNSVSFTYKNQSTEPFDLKAGNYFFLFGKKTLLSPGEWFRDKATGYLYLWLSDGSNPSQHAVEAQKIDKIIDVWDRSHITLKGMRVHGGRVNTSNLSSHLILEELELYHGGNFLYHDAPYLWKSPVVSLRGAHSAIRNSDIHDVSSMAIWVSPPTSETGAVEVSNNVVRNSFYGAQVALEGSGGTVVRNTLRNSADDRIVDLSKSWQSVVEYNDLGNSGNVIVDEGIVFLGRDNDYEGSRISRNHIHDGHGLVGSGWYGTAGVYVEGNTQNFLVYQNIMENLTSPAVNLIAFGSQYIRNAKIYNNSSNAGLYFINKNYHPLTDYTGTEIINNVFTRMDNSVDRSDLVFRSNAFTQQKWENNFETVDPGFASRYQLASGSPLIDAGENVGTPSLLGEFAGQKRDLGARESGGTDWGLPGATLRGSDVQGLKLGACLPSGAVARCTFTGAPPGRVLPDSFQVQLGDNAPSSPCRSANECAQVPYTQGAAQEVRVRLGDGPWFRKGCVKMP